MELFVKACGAILLSVVILATLGKNSADISVALSVAVCVMVSLSALEYLKPVLSFFTELEALSGMDRQMLRILLKSVGISLISEIAAMICNDSGSSALGKSVKLLAAVVIIWLSLPLYTAFLELFRQILGGL